MFVTVSCAKGDTGFVYEGELPFEVQRTDLKSLAKPRTKVMINLANPEEAFALCFIPNDGVGLARMEFIISHYIKIHPLALINFAQLADAQRIRIKKGGHVSDELGAVERIECGALALGAHGAFGGMRVYPADLWIQSGGQKSNSHNKTAEALRLRLW